MIAANRSDRALRDVLSIPWRHKGKVLLFFVAVVGAATAVTLALPKVYRSEGKLLLRLGRENMSLDPTATFGATPLLVQQSRENEINSVIEILRSRVLVEKVVDALGPEAILDRPPKSEMSHAEVMTVSSSTTPTDSVQDREKAIVRFIKSLDVEAARKSNVVQISYDGPSPALAQTVVNRLVEFFLDEHIRLNRTPGVAGILVAADGNHSSATQGKRK